jgi:hypothetical protein
MGMTACRETSYNSRRRFTVTQRAGLSLSGSGCVSGLRTMNEPESPPTRTSRVRAGNEHAPDCGAQSFKAAVDLSSVSRSRAHSSTSASTSPKSLRTHPSEVRRARYGKRGRTFALRFRAYGKRNYVTTTATSREEAQTELANVLADVRRGIWRPPPQTYSRHERRSRRSTSSHRSG